MEQEKIKKMIENVIDEQARTTVGIMMKRVECLAKEDVLHPTLFKSLIKEIIYEQSRALKRIMKAHFNPSVHFKSNKNKDV